VIIRPARVFDGAALQEGWAVRIRGERIEAAGPAAKIAAVAATPIDLPGTTLLPGLIEGHSHVLLHPYNETSWDDQVLKESQGVRIARAVNHLRATLMAGFTTIRDLGTEGAGYADAELKQAVTAGIIPGPRLLVTTRAIVATGSYGPKGFSLEWRVPQGAEEADGEALTRVVRDHPKARELEGGAGGRRHDPERERRRRLQPRRQRPRARIDGELRHGADRRAEERDVNRGASAAHGGSDRADQRKACWQISWPSTATALRKVRLVMKGGAVIRRPE
jgi:hypothetical protein